ncbi:hypothetical protein OY671_009131, partial [Metschnikowia pulcherrima]
MRRVVFYARAVTQMTVAGVLASVSWPSGRHHAVHWSGRAYANYGKLTLEHMAGFSHSISFIIAVPVTAATAYSGSSTSSSARSPRPQPQRRDMRFDISREMAHYFQRSWMERVNAEPTPDSSSMMIHYEAMKHVSPQEFMGNSVRSIVGGNDTTRNTMSGIVHALDQFADHRDISEKDPSIIPN